MLKVGYLHDFTDNGFCTNHEGTNVLYFKLHNLCQIGLHLLFLYGGDEVGLTSGLTHKTHTHTHPHLIIVIGHRLGAPGADPDEPEGEGGEDEPDGTGEGVGQGERPTPEERGHSTSEPSLWTW